MDNWRRAVGEALFRARKELEEYDAKMNPEQTTDSKEVAHADAKCEKIALDKVPPHIV